MTFFSKWLRLVATVAAGLIPLLARAGEKAPNLLYILADDLGRGDYSAFGTADVRTPHIDRLVREGMECVNFRANSCVCSPTRAALLTGCYPDRVGVPGVIRGEQPANSWGWLSAKAVLLPRVLHGAGYHSALVGKWHLGLSAPNTPNERGFDFFKGFLGDMMDDYWTHLRNGRNLMRENTAVIEPEGHATDLFTRWACEYLESRAGREDPFFLYLAYNAPHDPIQPPPQWLEKVRGREPGISVKRAALVALIEHMDAGVGAVLEKLDALGLAQNTLVVFTSDNGGVLSLGANNGPWRGAKQQMYEGGLRVPCVARWPGRIAPGSRTEQSLLTMDLFATACEVAGVEPPAGIDGRSFLSTLRGSGGVVPGRAEYYVRREGGAAYGGKTIEALREGDWKLLQNSPFAPLELYNLREDPLETRDVAGKEKAVFERMSAALRVHVQRGGVVPWQPADGGAH